MKPNWLALLLSLAFLAIHVWVLVRDLRLLDPEEEEELDDE